MTDNTNDGLNEFEALFNPVIAFLLPPDAGPLVYEHIVHGAEGIRVFAITDQRGNPSLGICKVDGGEQLPLGGAMSFEHDTCVIDRNIRFGRFVYTTIARVNWTGLTVEIFRSSPNVSPLTLILTHQAPWSDANKPLFAN